MILVFKLFVNHENNLLSVETVCQGRMGIGVLKSRSMHCKRELPSDTVTNAVNGSLRDILI